MVILSQQPNNNNNNNNSNDTNGIDIDETIIEIVGSIDVGISAALWSIDEETLAIITNENKLLLLSRVLNQFVKITRF